MMQAFPVVSIIKTVIKMAENFVDLCGLLWTTRFLWRIRYVFYIYVDEENKSSQIDHILFHTSGIYVIETKNFSGRIYGKESDKAWTQVLAKGKVKNKFYSPVLQNQKHIERTRLLIKL